jgi:hypothetical protein
MKTLSKETTRYQAMRDEEVNDWEQGVRWLPGTVKRVV